MDIIIIFFIVLFAGLALRIWIGFALLKFEQESPKAFQSYLKRAERHWGI